MSVTYRERVTAIYKAYAPERLGSVDGTLDKYRGNEPDLIRALVLKYGREPGVGNIAVPPCSEPNPYHRRVTAIYQKYAPEKLGTVDATLEKYRGSESALIDALVKKYGPEPADAGGSAPASPIVQPAAEPSSSRATSDYHRRVTAIYQKYAPEKLGTVDVTLEKYRGSESALIEALVKKYGPEPPDAGPVPNVSPIVQPPAHPPIDPADLMPSIDPAFELDSLLLSSK